MSQTHHVDVPVGVLFSQCSLPFGGWIPQDEAQGRTVRLLRKRNFIRLPTDFGKSISDTTIAYQMFSFVSDSIKLGRACRSNDYSILTTKLRYFFMTIYALHVNH